VAGQGAEDEVAVRGQGVEAGRAVVVGAGGGGQAGAQEPGQALGGGRVGVEAAAGSGDLVAADVLGGLEDGVRPDREAVEAGVVHPDPDREPADGEGGRVGRAEVAELLLGDDQGQLHAELGDQAGAVQASAQSSTRPARKVVSPVATSTEPPRSRTAVTGVRSSRVAPKPAARRCMIRVPRAAGTMPPSACHRPWTSASAGRQASGASPRRRPASGRGRRRPPGWPGRGRAGWPRWPGTGRGRRWSPPGAPPPPVPAPPRPGRRAGQAHVAGRVVGAADDARVVVGRPPVVAQLELLQPQHPGPGPGQRPGGGAPQRPQPHDHGIPHWPSRRGARLLGWRVAPGGVGHSSSPRRSRT
jgi:hypothetical protein